MLHSSDIFLKELIVDKDTLFAISNYQRHYVWNEERVSAFFHDICNTSRKLEKDSKFTHFFGQMILREIEEDRRGRKTYEVIDGQQRLTTLILILAIFYGKLEQLKKEYPRNKKIEEEQKVCLKYVCSQKEGANEQDRLSLSDIDNSYFKIIIASLRSNKAVEASETKLQSHKALFQAQDVLTKLLSEDIDQYKNGKNKLNRITQLRKTVSEKFQVVAVYPTDEKYTFQLYQVVNDRGQPLTDCELLKAKTIEVLAGNQNATEKARQIWNDLLNDTGATSETYLKWCYMSTLGIEKDTKDRYYQAFIQDYFHVSGKEHFTAHEQDVFLRRLTELKSDFEYCRKLSKGEWPIADSNYPKWKKDILVNLVVSMRHTLCIPVLLSALHTKPNHGATVEDLFFRCLEYCETFFVLYKGVLDYRETKFKGVYLKAATDLRDPNNKNALVDFRNALCEIEKKLTRETCDERLKSLVYIPKSQNTIVKYLLILFETYYSCFSGSKVNTKNVADGRTLVYNDLSIEHIYDETLKEEEQDKTLEPHKHHLGNLVIYGKTANSRLPKEYDKKRKKYLESGVLSAAAVANTYPVWDYNGYDKRQNEICEKLSVLLLRFFPTSAPSTVKPASSSQNKVSI